MWPIFSQEEISAAAAVLESGRVNYWTGTEGRSFEAEFAQRFGCRHGVAAANGTLALDLALRACGVKPGDEVIVTPRSFIASASTVALLRARPVFADVDRESQGITAQSIEPLITDRTRAILPVHLGGWPCDMPAIMALASSRGLAVVEDCAQAHGAVLYGKPAGSLGHVAAFSFCQDKIMTTAGEGGMLLTDDEAIYTRAWSFKDHGKSLSKMNSPGTNGAFRYVHDELGSNYRMAEFQAAIGRVQLRKLNGWLEARRKNAATWDEALSGVPGIRVTIPPSHVEHAYYKYYAFVESSALKTGWNRDRVLAELRSADVTCFSGTCPEIYLEKAFATSLSGSAAGRLPRARELGDTSLMFLTDPTVTRNDIGRWVEHVKQVMARAVR